MVWKWFDPRCKNGVWERIAKALQDEELRGVLEEIQIDSTSIKAHPIASTGRKTVDEKKTTLILIVVLAAVEAD